MFKMITVISIYMYYSSGVKKKISLSNQLWEGGILAVLTLIETLSQWSSSSNSVISLNVEFGKDANNWFYKVNKSWLKDITVSIQPTNC